MLAHTYTQRRTQLKTYFDRTAVEAWARLTSDAPVSKIRATVRAGRDQMRNTLLSWLPQDLQGARILDAGCGTGAFAVEAAGRGADVVAVDLSPTLIAHARERASDLDLPGHITFVAGDMLSAEHGAFDYVVAMDSLIHYRTADVVGALSHLTARAREAVLFTYAPRTPALAMMHTVGRIFPRGDRAPSIEPVHTQRLMQNLAQAQPLAGWAPGRTERVASGFYISQAQELHNA